MKGSLEAATIGASPDSRRGGNNEYSSDNRGSHYSLISNTSAREEDFCAIPPRTLLADTDGDAGMYYSGQGHSSLPHHPSPLSLSFDLRARAILYRRTTIVLLVLAVHYFMWNDWKSLRWVRPTLPVRGGVGMRPVGEVCHRDQHTGSLYRIHNRHAIVFDAGSTGSRVHVYEFQYCGPHLRVLIDELFAEVKPGLSHWGAEGNPQGAAQSLQPLLAQAMKRVPVHLHESTPLVVRATAGLRLLPETAVKGILTHVRSKLRTTGAFVLGGIGGRGEGNISVSTLAHVNVNEEEAVSVMDGAEEGVFAWVTVNFLQSRLPGSTLGASPDDLFSLAATNLSSAASASAMAVVMDLGGASTQIVFAVPSNGSIEHGQHPEYYYRLKLHGHTYELYQHSYLGYGLIEARKRIKIEHVKRMLAGSHDGRPLSFPCFPSSYREEIHLDGEQIALGPDEGGPKKSSHHTLVGDAGITGWDACLATIAPLFDSTEPCSLPPCSFRGTHQPPINSAAPIVAFSYFFDRLVPLGLRSPVTLFEVDREGRRLCKSAAGERHAGSRFGSLLAENPQWCLDLAYIYSLLRVGYRLDIDQPIEVTKQINGYEAGWSLGAALKLLEGTKIAGKREHNK